MFRLINNHLQAYSLQGKSQDAVHTSQCVYISEIFKPYHLPRRVKKSVPLQAWNGPEGSKKLRLPDFMTTAQDGGKVVSLRHRPPLPPGNTPGTHFC